MRRFIGALCLSTSALFAGTINIAVASNVSYAIDELKSEFHKSHPTTKVRVTLGSSGKLTAQIKHRAPYGVFMSANMLYPQRLYKENLALLEPQVYAQGTLSFFTLKKYDLSRGFELLKSKDIRRIAIANPKTAPYGKATFDALQTLHLHKPLQSKFIYGESISQTLSYTMTAADIGIVASASLYSPKMQKFQEGKNWMKIEPEFYHPIKQGIVLLKEAKGSQEYRDFYEFILSQKAEQIFKKYGYII